MYHLPGRARDPARELKLVPAKPVGGRGTMIPVNGRVAEGVTLGERVKKGAAELDAPCYFDYGAAFRRLVARR